MTEQEIDKGITSIKEKDPKALFFIRNFKELNKYPRDQNLTDSTTHNMGNEKAQNQPNRSLEKLLKCSEAEDFIDLTSDDTGKNTLTNSQKID